MDKSKLNEDTEEITEESFTPSDTSEKYQDVSHENETSNIKSKNEAERTKNATHQDKDSENKRSGSTKSTVDEGNQTDVNKGWVVVDKESLESSNVEDELQRIRQMAENQEFIPKRYVLLVMIFLGFIVIYAMRVNLNVAIVAMVNNRTVITRSGAIRKYKSEFDWDPGLQGIVIGSFYYGYWVLQVPGAFIAMRLGGTRVFGYGVFMASLLSIITPVATRYSVHALITIRIFQGLALGVTFPCNHAVWAKWAPPLERSTLVTMAIAGCPVGNILAIPITGMLAKYGFDGGWPSVFYCFGMLGLIWYLSWEFIVYDSPATHPTISKAERAYLEGTIGEKPFNPLTESTPWKSILTSIPMWGITVGHFGACWGYYTLFTQMPTYLKDIHHLDMKTMGFVAATPYILKSFIGPVGGISADIIIRRKWFSVGATRAIFYGVGCVVAGSFILATGYCVGKEDAILFLILGIGFSGLNATGYAVNHLDIAPRYAGLLMGVSNTFATIPGFLSPMVTGMIARHKKTSEWRKVFWITFVVYIVCTGLYSIMCSGEKQPWASGPPQLESQPDSEEESIANSSRTQQNISNSSKTPSNQETSTK